MKKSLTVADLITKLSTLPQDAVLLFEVEGSACANITGVRFRKTEATPEPYCCEECNKDINPEIFKDKVILSAEPEAQVNLLAKALQILVDSFPNKRQAICIKGRSGIYQSTEDLRILDDWPPKFLTCVP